MTLSALGALTTNLWIDALPQTSRATLLDVARPMTLHARQTLHEPGEASPFIYFPVSSVLSMVIGVGEGKTVEALMVGREGYSPVTPSLVPLSNTVRTIVQVPGEALAVEEHDFAHVLQTDPTIANFRARYLAAIFDGLMQSTACNAVHSVRERCARWLLSLADRTQSHDINIIHQVLAETLGASRPRVTEILASLQKDGLLELQRATLRITNHDGLLAASCECYGIIKREMDDFSSRPIG